MSNVYLLVSWAGGHLGLADAEACEFRMDFEKQALGEPPRSAHNLCHPVRLRLRCTALRCVAAGQTCR